MSRTSRSSSGGSKNGSGSKSGSGGEEKSRRRRKSSRKKKKVDPKSFWGDPAKLAEHTPGPALITSKPSAVVSSLGRPPLSGQQHAAEHYFVAVYDRAVNLAGALAAAGELIEPEELLDGERLGR